MARKRSEINEHTHKSIFLMWTEVKDSDKGLSFTFPTQSEANSHRAKMSRMRGWYIANAAEQAQEKYPNDSFEREDMVEMLAGEWKPYSVSRVLPHPAKSGHYYFTVRANEQAIPETVSISPPLD